MEWRLCKHGDRWGVRIGGSRYRLPVTYGRDTRAEAEALASEVARQHKQQFIGSTVEAICTAYLDDMANRANPKNPERQMYALKRILPYVGKLQPVSITREVCRTFIERSRKAGLSDGSIISSISALRTALRWHDARTPARFELPPTPPRRDRFLTREEVERLLEASQGRPHINLFIRLALQTAGRREAILGLRWDTHVDFSRGTIWLGFKAGGKNRAPHMSMPQSLKAPLFDAYKNRISDYVIEHHGKPIKSVRKGLKAVYEEAGITDVPNPSHVLRHTACVWMAEAGVSMKEIADRAGHSSITTTERIYAKFSPEGFRKSTEVLEI